MPASTRSTPARRRQRSVRIGVAVALLSLAGLVLVTALAVGSTLAWVSAALLSYAAGVAATRIVANELAAARREAARDRAQQAREHAALTRGHAVEHERRVAALSRALARTDETTTSLREQLSRAEDRAADSSHRFFRESRRTARLQESVAALQRELAERDDMLATWDGAEETAAVVDLIAWEQRKHA